MVAARPNRTALVAMIQAVRERDSDSVELDLSVQSTSAVEGPPTC